MSDDYRRTIGLCAAKGDNPMIELPMGRELTQHRPINAEPVRTVFAESELLTSGDR